MTSKCHVDSRASASCDPGISFVLESPGVLCPDCAIEIDEQHVATLALESADDAVVMAAVTLGVRPRPTFSARSS